MRKSVERAATEWRTDVVEPVMDRTATGDELDQRDVAAAVASFDEVRRSLRLYRAEILHLREEAIDEIDRNLFALFLALAAAGALLVLLGMAVWMALQRWVLRPLDYLGPR